MQISINRFPITVRFHEVDAVHHTPHKGIDFGLPLNTPVPCVSDGVVLRVMDEGNVSFGKSVWVQLNDGTTAIFGHLNGFAVQEGQHIAQGQIIGYSGNTGFSTGPHLHLQVMKAGVAIDPTPYLVEKGHSFTESVRGLYDFLVDLKTNSVFHALTGETFGQWFFDRVDAMAIMIALGGALLGMMGWKKGWSIVYFDAGLYIVCKAVQSYMGVA